MTTNERLAQLRAEMARVGLNAYILPSADPHGSEYPPAHFEARCWFSGFDGSAGTLVVTEQASGLWTDGRYFLQAENQLRESEIQLYRMSEPGVPTYIQYLVKTLPQGSIVGFDGRLLPQKTVEEIHNAFAEKQLKTRTADCVENAWTVDRPEMPATTAFLHHKKYTGLTAGEKLTLLRLELEKQKADSMVISKLDCVAWLLNLRADDIEFNPYAVAYCVVLADSAELFVRTDRIPAAVRVELEQNGIRLHEYEILDEYLANFHQPAHFLCDPLVLNHTLCRLLEQNTHLTTVPGTDPVLAMKGTKNPTEMQSLVEAHVKDGCAMVAFKLELEDRMSRSEPVTEYDICKLLRQFRSQQPDHLGESFYTIAAYRENAAMMHYHPTQAHSKRIEPSGFLLVDSGAHYLEGTTDVTRTFVMGPLTAEERRDYTLVLKAHIGLASAVFPAGCTGGNLDVLARRHLWSYGLNYRCGTGHGVSFLGNVHEGPQGLRLNNQIPFRVGMTITDEPGIYTAGSHGVRTENLLMVSEKMKTEYGIFLQFEPISYFPIDTAALELPLLADEELDWLNSYHQTVRDKLSPRLVGRQLDWLLEHTQALYR